MTDAEACLALVGRGDFLESRHNQYAVQKPVGLMDSRLCGSDFQVFQHEVIGEF